MRLRILCKMKTRSGKMEDWEELARKANWSVIGLAELRHVSVRTLQRYFPEVSGRPPKEWLIEQRMKRAIEMLRGGASVKETASELGYQQVHNFLRDFKRYWGSSPKKIFGSNQSKILQNMKTVAF